MKTSLNKSTLLPKQLRGKGAHKNYYYFFFELSAEDVADNCYYLYSC